MEADKELKKMSRMELLQLLILEAKKNADLEEENRKLKEALQSREIHIQQSGTLAEAALRLNGVFEAAEAAVRDYLYNIKLQNPPTGGENEAAELPAETEVPENG